MTMTTKEAKKLAAVHEMEEQFWGLVRRRIVITGLAVLLVGAGAGWAAIELVVQRVAETPLRELQKEVVRAEVQADAAKRANETAKTSSEQVTAALNALNATIQGLSEQAKSVEVRFKLVTEEINATSQTANVRSQRDFDALQRRIVALDALVKQIGEENAATRKATAEYAKQVASLAGTVEREQKRFAENSAYTVSIFFDPSRKALATELQGRLTALGFRAPVHEAPAKTLKGNALSYHGESEAKAQEVLALVKPVVKDVQAKKAPEIMSKWSDIYKSGQIDKDSPKADFKGHLTYGLIAWSLDPKGMTLALGGN